MDTTRMVRTVRWIERGLAAVGVVCLTWAGTVSLSAVLYQSRHQTSLDRHISPAGQPRPDRLLDADVSAAELTASIGRLEIPRIGLSAVVAEGDDEHTLSIAIGHLPDTPLPWEDGNVALAGHRDTFFRPLRRIRVGDDIRFRTPRGDFRYRVVRHTVVDPEELWVLDASTGAELTLITCFPFDFLGPAPRRFIVHAERIPEAEDASRTAESGGGVP